MMESPEFEKHKKIKDNIIKDVKNIFRTRKEMMILQLKIEEILLD